MNNFIRFLLQCEINLASSLIKLCSSKGSLSSQVKGTKKNFVDPLCLCIMRMYLLYCETPLFTTLYFFAYYTGAELFSASCIYRERVFMKRAPRCSIYLRKTRYPPLSNKISSYFFHIQALNNVIRHENISLQCSLFQLQRTRNIFNSFFPPGFHVSAHSVTKLEYS